LTQTLASTAMEKEDFAHQASHDTLPKLANRVLFDQQVTAATTGIRPDSMLGAVLFIDLDDFKLVNDTYGHAAGDEVLLIVSDRLRAALRTTDLPSRFGGDEFGVLLTQMASVNNAAAAAR